MKYIYLSILFFVSFALNAQNITVTSLADDGSTGTLRWAINEANSDPDASTIEFDSSLSDTIKLTSSLPIIQADLNIKGSGKDKITISGNNLYGMFYVASSKTLTISSLHLTQGGSKYDQNGCMLFVNGSTILADDILITNTYQYMPIYSDNSGSLISFTNSTFTENFGNFVW